MLKVYYPFYNSFRCAGGDCPINCCQFCHIPLFEWESRQLGIKPQWLDIDGKGHDFRSFLHLENGTWMLNSSGGYCSLMDKDRMCSIQKLHGESVLPSVCRTFPRLITILPDRVEYGFDLCCPVAVESTRDWNIGEFVDENLEPVSDCGTGDAKSLERRKVMDAFADVEKSFRECLTLLSETCVHSVPVPEFTLSPLREDFLRKATALMYWSYYFSYDGFPGIEGVPDTVLDFIVGYIPSLSSVPEDFHEMSVHFASSLSEYVQRTGFDLEIEGRYRDSSEQF